MDRKLELLIDIVMNNSSVGDKICEEMSQCTGCKKCHYQSVQKSCIEEWLIIKTDENDVLPVWIQ